MSRFTIKTVDGSRYEINETPTRTSIMGLDCLYLERDGNNKYIVMDKIISITMRDEEEG